MIKPASTEVIFDQEDHLQHPERDLTLVIRGLRLGSGRVRLRNGTLVVSRAVLTGPRGQRKFTVVPPSMTSSKDRYRLMTTRAGDCDTAEVAAKKALAQDKEADSDA